MPLDLTLEGEDEDLDHRELRLRLRLLLSLLLQTGATLEQRAQAPARALAPAAVPATSGNVYVDARQPGALREYVRLEGRDRPAPLSGDP